MSSKATDDELERRVEELERELDESRRALQACKDRPRPGLSPSVGQYRQLVENASEGTIVSQDGIARFANRRILEMVGLAGLADGAIVDFTSVDYRAIIDFVHPDDRPNFLELRRMHAAGEPLPKTFEMRLLAVDGSSLMVEVRSVSIEWEGRPATLNFLSDITARKKADEQLRQSEESYRTILESSPDAISLARFGDSRYIAVNEAFTQTTGWTAAEALGRTPGDLEIFADRAQRRHLFDTLSARHRVNLLEMRCRAKDGSPFDALVSARVVPFKGEECVLTFVTVVTSLKKVEQALRESEEKYRVLAENALEGICVMQNGVMAFCNPTMLWLCGRSAEELARMPFARLVHRDDVGDVLDWHGRKLRGEGQSATCAFRMIRGNGELVWVEANAIPVEWSGRPAILEVLRDITLQKKMEAQLVQASKMEALGTLAGGIAHNFNNLLQGIEGNASALSVENPSLSRNDALRNIERLVRSGAALTKQLLGIARGGKYESRPSDLNALVRMSTDLFAQTRKEISVHMALADDLSAVKIDRNQIEQVLLNLFVNAWQAMPNGGQITVSTSNVILTEQEVRPYGLDPGRYVRVTVADTGVGMDPSTLRRAFDPFFTTKGLGAGTGLGLASSYGIVANHGGMLHATSHQGKGSTFHIDLPASDEVPLEEPRPPREEALRGTETILLVDDEPTILRTGRRLLERLGYDVATATGGTEAIEVFRAQAGRVALVVLDMIMPGLSGAETFDRLRCADPSVKVLLSSGYSLDGQAEAIMKRGCDGFIQKPYTASELSTKMRRILDG